MNKPELFNEDHAATYCPEDDKLRLYVGRVPRDEYLALKAEGWTSTPKQSENGQGEFAATWTPSREDTAISYAGVITDEDAGPVERAADRAERFGGYLDKRLGEAERHGDRYDGKDSAHGYQSYAAGVRAADRHDRIATRAVNAWDKAEYWQRRTAGVISNALYKSGPGVRMGRIKTLEAELRKAEKSLAEWGENFARVERIAADPDKYVAAVMARNPDLYSDAQQAARGIAENLVSYHFEIQHPRNPEIKGSAWTVMDPESSDPVTLAEVCAEFLDTYETPATAEEGNRGIRHLRNRLAYENQMLEAQGGRAGDLDIEVGGFWGGAQIHKVNKSTATGRVVSVHVKGPAVSGWTYKAANVPGTDYALHQFDTERKATGYYRAPTDEERAEFLAARKAEKKAAKATAPPTIPLVNPTMEEAQRLQDMFNASSLANHCRRHVKAYGRDYASEHKPSTILELTQATYSANSGGSYAKVETIGLAAGGEERDTSNMWTSAGEKRNRRLGPVVCKVRASGYDPKRVIVITDKPQKAFPPALWVARPTSTPADLLPRAREVVVAVHCQAKTPDQEALCILAETAGLAYEMDNGTGWSMTTEGEQWASAAGAFRKPATA